MDTKIVRNCNKTRDKKRQKIDHQNKHNIIKHIPNELFEMVMLYLDFKDLSKFKKLCKRFTIMFNNNKKRICKKRYNDYMGYNVTSADYDKFVKKLNDIDFSLKYKYHYNQREYYEDIINNIEFYIYYINNPKLVCWILHRISYNVEELDIIENILNTDVPIDINYTCASELTLIAKSILFNWSKNLIKLILKRKPNINIRTSNNISIMDIAKSKGEKDIIKMIEPYYIYDKYTVHEYKYFNNTKNFSIWDFSLLNFYGSPSNSSSSSDINKEAEVANTFQIIKNICTLNNIDYKTDLVISGSFAVYVYQMVNNITFRKPWKYNDVDIYYNHQIYTRDYNKIVDGHLLVQKMSPKNNLTFNEQRTYEQNYIKNIQEVIAYDIKNPNSEISFDFINVKKDTDINRIVESFDLDCCKLYITMDEDSFKLHINEHFYRDKFVKYANEYRNRVTKHRVEKYRTRGFQCK
jgi:hypothetical protein